MENTGRAEDKEEANYAAKHKECNAGSWPEQPGTEEEEEEHEERQRGGLGPPLNSVTGVITAARLRAN